MASEKTQVSAPGKNNRTVATPQNSTIYGKAALSGLDHMQHNGYGNSLIQSMNNYHKAFSSLLKNIEPLLVKEKE